MEYCLYSVGALVTLYGLGLGFTLWLLPVQLQRYAVIVAPVIGYCYCTIGCWHLYQFGARIDQRTAFLLAIPPAISLLLVYFKRPAALRQIVSSRPAVGAMMVASASFVVLSIPAFWRVRGLTTFSMFGHDAAQYATVARFFAEFGHGSVAGFVGQSGGWFDGAATYGYFGAFVFPAAIGGFLGIMPHHAISMSANLFAALTAATAFLILYETLRASTFASLIGVGLLGFHPILSYLAWQGFLAQMLAMPLAAALFWVNSKALEEHQRGQHLRYIALSAVLIAGLLLTYQHMLPFVFFFIGVYSVVLSAFRKEARILIVAVVVNALSAVAAALLCPNRVAALTVMVRDTATNKAGWFIPFLGPEYLTSMVVHRSPHVVPSPQLLLIAGAAALIVGWIVVGLRYGHSKSQRASFLIASLGIYAGSIVLAVKGDPSDHSGYYKSFKLASFFLPCFMCLIAASFGIRPPRPRRLFVGLDIMLVLAFAIGCFAAQKTLLRGVATANLRVPADYIDLLTVDRDPNVASINILGNDGWRLMWSVYFLMHKKIYMASPSYYSASPLQGAFDLEDATYGGRSRLATGRPQGTTRRINRRFALVGPLEEAKQ